MLFLSQDVLLSLADANVNVFCFLLFFKYLGGSGPENCLAVPGLLSTEILIRRRRDQGMLGKKGKQRHGQAEEELARRAGGSEYFGLVAT